MHDLYTLYMVSTTPDGKGGDKSCPIRRSVLWGEHIRLTTANYLLNQPWISLNTERYLESSCLSEFQE